MKAVVVALLLSVPVLAQNPAQTQKLSNLYIKNFHQVGEGFYRGGQPDPDHLDEAMAYLKSIGVGRVIDLRGKDDLGKREEAAAKKAGLQFESYPLSGFGAPSVEIVQKIESEIECSGCTPVFVHCKHGADRTGTIAAVYRINHGWTDEKAIKEMRQLGDSIFEFSMRHFVQGYYRQHLADKTNKVAETKSNDSQSGTKSTAVASQQ